MEQSETITHMQHTESLIYIKSLITTVIVDHFSIKAINSALFAIGSFLFSGLSDSAMLALLVLIVLDYLFAVYESRRKGEVWSSSKTKRTVVKILVYFTMIASGHLVEYGLPEPIQYLDDTILTFLLITEFLSIFKHLSNLGYKTPTKLINNLTEKVADM